MVGTAFLPMARFSLPETTGPIHILARTNEYPANFEDITHLRGSGFRIVSCRKVPNRKPRCPRVRSATGLCSITGSSRYEVDQPDLETLCRAVVTRLLFHKKLVGGQTVWVEVPHRNAAFGEVSALKDKFVYQFVRVWSHQEFCQSFVGKLRQRYERANAELSMSGFITAKDSWISGFVKFEKCSVKDGRDPRLISPRSPKFNLAIGIYLKPLEKALYRAIDFLFGHRVVLKGFNALEQGKILREHWCAVDDPVCIMIDASRFDEHVHQDALRFEHDVYRGFFPGDSEFSRILDFQLNNTFVCNADDGYLKFEVKGRRMSGDMNTSMGNVLLMSSMMYQYLCQRLPQGSWRFADNGDDCLVILPGRLLHLVGDLGICMECWGFPCTIDGPVDSFESIEFCQTHPVFDGENWVMVRDPRTCITKDWIVTKRITEEHVWRSYRREIALCGLAAYANMPIFRSMYRCMLRGCERSKAVYDSNQSGLRQLARGMHADDREPSDAARVSFFCAFGIPPVHQRAIEMVYDRMTVEWVFQTHPYTRFHFA